jgi:uncharacterized protein YqjF (DUF2071 family)
MTATSLITAEWRDLVILSYEVDPLLLVPLVPAGTSLDFHEGKALASIVGFRFLDTRIAGLPVPLHQNFEQVNFRFYVWRQVGSEIRQGAVFIKEIVPSLTLSLGARLFFNENYVAAPMRHEVLDSEQGWAAYEWLHGEHWQHVSATRGGHARAAGANSIEAFVKDRPWGYARQRDGSTLEFRAEHPAWDYWPAIEPRLNCDIAAVFGPEYLTTLARHPVSTIIAVGSPATLYPGQPVD